MNSQRVTRPSLMLSHDVKSERQQAFHSTTSHQSMTIHPYMEGHLHREVRLAYAPIRGDKELELEVQKKNHARTCILVFALTIGLDALRSLARPIELKFHKERKFCSEGVRGSGKKVKKM